MSHKSASVNKRSDPETIVKATGKFSNYCFTVYSLAFSVVCKNQKEKKNDNYISRRSSNLQMTNPSVILDL